MPNWQARQARREERERKYEAIRQVEHARSVAQRQMADDIHADVAEKLAALGIDPVELRNYLAALP